MNYRSMSGNYPLLRASYNVESVKLLIDYATKNNIILEMNEKNKLLDYPLLKGANNFEILKIFN